MCCASTHMCMLHTVVTLASLHCDTSLAAWGSSACCGNSAAVFWLWQRSVHAVRAELSRSGTCCVACVTSSCGGRVFAACGQLYGVTLAVAALQVGGNPIAWLGPHRPRGLRMHMVAASTQRIGSRLAFVGLGGSCAHAALGYTVGSAEAAILHRCSLLLAYRVSAASPSSDVCLLIQSLQSKAAKLLGFCSLRIMKL